MPDNHQLSFSQIGTVFNQIADDLQGGVSPASRGQVLTDIKTVQTQLQGLIDSNALAPLGDVSVVHAQNIHDQLNFLTAEVKAFGTDPYAPKFINDVVRDIQDIVAGDPGLTALAHQSNHNGFQQVSNLLTPPAPFPDSPSQTATLLQFVSDSNSLSERANALVGADPHSADVQTLIHDIETFSTNADSYSGSQGGLFSARFNNEFTLNGVQGTASRELVLGLQHQDAQLVHAAGQVLEANAQDVQMNMLTQTGTYTPPVNGGIPANIETVQQAGQVFDDAVTKLLGGVSPANQASVIADLHAVSAGLQQAVDAQDLGTAASHHVAQIVKILADETQLVSQVTTPQQVSMVNAQIAADETRILHLVGADPQLSSLNVGDGQGTPGFTALPPTHGAEQINHHIDHVGAHTMIG